MKYILILLCVVFSTKIIAAAIEEIPGPKGKTRVSQEVADAGQPKEGRKHKKKGKHRRKVTPAERPVRSEASRPERSQTRQLDDRTLHTYAAAAGGATVGVRGGSDAAECDCDDCGECSVA